MSVTFYIANTREEVDHAKYGVYLEDEVHDYLWKNAKDVRHNLNLLIHLDPYDNKQFNVHEVKRLKRICEILIKNYNELDIAQFSKELFALCVEALKNDCLVYALGD
ncbi:hypothetical protein WAX78_14985 [Bacillus sp. FJAT-53711]|uniref:Uncharacterized protein n=1 Tax=Bacillus yunxiaonensis TaxID=3127665 RepID=A0ABU8FS45_9BACI